MFYWQLRVVKIKQLQTMTLNYSENSLCHNHMKDEEVHMFKTLSNSLVLARECWEVLMKDKEMLVYPTLTSIVNIAIMFVAYLYLAGMGFFEAEVALNYSNAQWASGAAIAVATMYACHFSFSFFDCALVASAIKRLRGENPTLGYGLGVAANRIPQLAGWSFYVTIFGLFVAALKSLFKTKWLQKLVGGAAETAWNVVTVFVMPFIVVEEMGATKAVKQSASLIRKRWGEAATLEIGFGSLTSMAGFPLAMLFMLAASLGSVSPFLSAALIGLTVLLGAFLGILFAALTGIAKAVLFNFALGGNIPNEIHDDVLEGTVVRRNTVETDIQGRYQT